MKYKFVHCSILLLLILVCTSGCSHSLQAVRSSSARVYKICGKTYRPVGRVRPGYFMNGKASWYGPGFHGKKTASGEVYDMNRLTAAHKTLPLNTLVRVTNLSNGKHTVVRINDRGPFVGNRVIDLSYAAAKELEIVKRGVAPVRVTVLGFAESRMARGGNLPWYRRTPLGLLTGLFGKGRAQRSGSSKTQRGGSPHHRHVASKDQVASETDGQGTAGNDRIARTSSDVLRGDEAFGLALSDIHSSDSPFSHDVVEGG